MSNFITKEQLYDILKDLKFDCEGFCIFDNNISVDWYNLKDTIERHTEDDEEGVQIYSSQYIKQLKEKIIDLENEVLIYETKLEEKVKVVKEEVIKNFSISYDMEIKSLKSSKTELENKIKRLEEGLGVKVDDLLNRLYIKSLQVKNDYLEKVLKDFEEDMAD